jgi:deoxyribodipyrimidine photolyase-related protein
MEVIRAVENHWQQHPEAISLAQAEGFIRQILGWREYMRGIYWANMPEYETLNFFGHDRPLPGYFWTGNTRMNCISKAVSQSLDYAYAHHIQRLMVTGNFSLLAGIDPNEIDNWYLGIYIDAFQWVEITNTRGMSQFADGGIVGTKPYIASASYIHIMGDHCGACHYDHKKRTGEGACPFNSLYWRFLAVHEDKLANNQRMSMMYRVWHKMAPEIQHEILEQADKYLEQIEAL